MSNTKLKPIAAAAVVLLMFIASVGGWVWQTRHRASQPDPQIMAALHRLERVWTSFPNRNAGKDGFHEASGVLGAKVSECSPAELEGIIRYLAAQHSDAPTSRKRNEFDDGFLGTLECECINHLTWARSDRNLLLYLLSRVPRNRVKYVCIETALGFDLRESRIDPEHIPPDELFSVLFDAFDGALTPSVRASTLAAIQRSFRDQPGDPETGAEYVAQCRAWFTENFDRIEAKIEHMNVYGDESWRDVPPLFVIRKSE